MANLRLYVTTSDYYNPLIPGFAHLFNKYWSPDQEVTFWCYTRPSYSLPNNFSICSLGPPANFGNEIPEWSEGRRGVRNEPYPTPRWTDSLLPFVQSMTDEHFILMQIDYFINRPVELDKIELLKSFLCFSDVAKIDLTLDRTYHTHYLYATHGKIKIIVSDQKADYRSSLQAAIWRRDYFLSLLKPNRSPWDFERIGMDEMRNDGKLILGLHQPDFGPVSYVNLYSKGKIERNELNKIDHEVLGNMFELGLIRDDWNGWE